MSWLSSTLLALDTETTGIDPETDRLITVAIGRSAGPGDWSLIENSLVNPGVPIPAEATKVHGITDDQAADGADPVEVLESVLEVLTQAAERRVPIVGHNLAYDLTLLDREMRRHGLDGLPDGLLCLDTMVIFRRFDYTTGGRSLSALAEKYGIGFPAHNAERDALASLRLLHIIARDNDLLPLAPIDALQTRQAEWHRAYVTAAEERRRANGGEPREISTDWPMRPSLISGERVPA